MKSPTAQMPGQYAKFKGTNMTQEKHQTLKYCVPDVFTKEKYKGNRLAVVFTEGDLELSLYENISKEFGYSEAIHQTEY
jgi:hypothetical protein